MRAASDLRDDDRRASADGGLLPRPRHRADLPAAAQADDARDRRLPHAGRGDLPQPRLRVDREAVSGAGVQGDERAVGAGADVAGQGAGGRGRVGERARPAGGVVGGAQQHRSRARRALHDGTGGRARPLEPRLHLRLEDGDRRDEEVAGGGIHAGVADGDRDGRGDEGAGGCDVGVAGDRCDARGRTSERAGAARGPRGADVRRRRRGWCAT